MTQRIFRAICAAALAVIFVTMAMIMGVLYEHFSNIQREQLQNETALAVQGVERLGPAYFVGLAIRGHRLTWVGADGKVLYDSAASSDAMENHLEREEIRAALASGHGESSRYSSTLLERSLYCARRLDNGANKGTVLRLSVAHDSIIRLLLGMFQPVMAIVVIAIVLAFILAKGLARRIVQPLNQLDLDRPLENDGYDELSPLLQRIHNQQKELAKAELRRREFTANASHELKTPLHTISGYSELLKCGIVKPEDINKFSDKIYHETQRLIALVQDIIDLSHLDEGGRDLEQTEVDLYASAEQVVQDLADVASVNGITLSMAGQPTVVHGSPQLVRTMIHNLCDNAIKYNRQGGKVTVRVDNNGFSVQDSGIGIPHEDLDRIFERFYRVDKGRSKKVGGTGLGLSIVKHAAQIHDAKIDVNSTVGKGTSITVSFPESS